MRDDQERALDILEAIERIERVVQAGKDTFYSDEMAQVWVVHHLLIVGEAANGLSLQFREQHSSIPWSEMVGMINILIHHYFGIDKEAVWQVVKDDLPKLQRYFTHQETK